MGLITDISPQKKDPKRVNIFLDGKFAFGISLESKIVNHLKVREELTEKQIEKLIFDDQVERLYDKALRFLSSRPRSEREIRNYLLQKLKLTDKGEEEKKNFDDSIDEVIKKLTKIDQVNDLEFARWWVDQRTRFKKASPRIIKSELFQKGIDKEIVTEVLESSEIDPYELAHEAAKKKLSSYQKLDQKTFREKMSRYLASKGFDWEIIKKVIDTHLEKE
ncbi:MAG TPA: RecX family transcriptional regulator [Candidatus Saccharimonadales bacterium]|nr:RecX family transcriptional regulator [Candidatus Saccharimonadales bacterium]